MKIEVGQIYSELDDKFVITCIDTYQSNQVGYGTLGIHKLYNNGKVDFETYSLLTENEYSYINSDNFIIKFDNWMDAINSFHFQYNKVKHLYDVSLEDLILLKENKINTITLDENKIKFHICCDLPMTQFIFKIISNEPIKILKGEISNIFKKHIDKIDYKNNQLVFYFEKETPLILNIDLTKSYLYYEREKYVKAIN